MVGGTCISFVLVMTATRSMELHQCRFLMGLLMIFSWRISMVTIDTQVLHSFKKEISIMAQSLSCLKEQIAYINLCFNKTGKMLKNVHMSFNSKILILDDLLKKYQIADTPRNVLDKFVKTGNCCPALQDFLGKELYDCKIISRMESKISTIFDEIQEFVLQYIINTIEKMIVNVSYLEGLAMNPETS